MKTQGRVIDSKVEYTMDAPSLVIHRPWSWMVKQVQVTIGLEVGKAVIQPRRGFRRLLVREFGRHPILLTYHLYQTETGWVEHQRFASVA